MQELLVQIKHTMSIVNLSKEKKHNQGRAITKCSKKMGKYHDDGKNKASSKPKTDDKEKDKKKKKEDNFPGPGA